MRKETSYGIMPFAKEESEWKVFLILHKKGNHWGFPKGHAQKNESPLEAAMRELKEETTLNVEKILLPTPLSEEYSFLRSHEKIVKTVIYFPAIVSGEPHLQEEEISDGKWLTFSEAMKRLTFPEARALFNQALHELKQAFQGGS